jgi:hypothetical protein
MKDVPTVFTERQAAHDPLGLRFAEKILAHLYDKIDVIAEKFYEQSYECSCTSFTVGVGTA